MSVGNNPNTRLMGCVLVCVVLVTLCEALKVAAAFLFDVNGSACGWVTSGLEDKPSVPLLEGMTACLHRHLSPHLCRCPPA